MLLEEFIQADIKIIVNIIETANRTKCSILPYLRTKLPLEASPF